MQEPFLINSPRRRRRGAGGRFVKRRRSRRRRNPDAVIYNAPRRRRRSRSRRRRRGYRRNPPRLALIGQLQDIAPKLGWGAVGAVGAEAIPGFVGRFFPLPGGQMGNILVKLGSGLGVAFLVRQFVGRSQGNAALVGALLPPVIDTVRTFVGPMIGMGAYIPTVPLGAYLEPGGMGYLSPGQVMGDEDLVPAPGRLSPDSRL